MEGNCCEKKLSPNNYWSLLNRPGVAGAVLQSPMLLIHSVGQRVIHFFPNLQDTFTFKPYELGALKGRKMLLSLEQILVQTIFAPNIYFFFRIFLCLWKNMFYLTSASYLHAGTCWAKQYDPSHFGWPITIGEWSFCLLKHISFVLFFQNWVCPELSSTLFPFWETVHLSPCVTKCGG